MESLTEINFIIKFVINLVAFHKDRFDVYSSSPRSYAAKEKEEVERRKGRENILKTEIW